MMIQFQITSEINFIGEFQSSGVVVECSAKSTLAQNKGASYLCIMSRVSYISSCSILIFIPSIRDLSCDASLVVMLHAITGRETPHALPSAILLHK